MMDVYLELYDEQPSRRTINDVTNCTKDAEDYVTLI